VLPTIEAIPALLACATVITHRVCKKIERKIAMDGLI
jgi:hypothetical protein